MHPVDGFKVILHLLDGFDHHPKFFFLERLVHLRLGSLLDFDFDALFKVLKYRDQVVDVLSAVAKGRLLISDCKVERAEYSVVVFVSFYHRQVLVHIHLSLYSQALIFYINQSSIGLALTDPDAAEFIIVNKLHSY